MIIFHDLGQRLGSYGGSIATPNIDSIAEEGVRFENYFCTAAQCSPSRGSINTGRYPHQNGLMGLAHEGFGWELDESETTLPMYMNKAGFETHLFGLQHESKHPKNLGYEYVHGAGGGNCRVDPVSSRLGEFLKEYGQASNRSPFFASVGFVEPHRPYGLSDYSNDDPSGVDPLPYLPDKKGIRKDLAGLNGLIYRVDETMGKIKNVLAETGLEEDTLLIFTTDHGIAMPRAKGTCYDPGIETALIMSKPGEFDGGKEYEELLSNVDLLPTLLEYAGTEVPRDIAGRSFLPLLNEESYVGRGTLWPKKVAVNLLGRKAAPPRKAPRA